MHRDRASNATILRWAVGNSQTLAQREQSDTWKSREPGLGQFQSLANDCFETVHVSAD